MNRRGYGQTQEAIRQSLRSNPDGLTMAQISAVTGLSYQALRHSATNMQDIYVDRWTPNDAGNDWAQVFCLKPDDAPKPDMRVSEYRRRMEPAHV